jgi:hypothetical protein
MTEFRALTLKDRSIAGRKVKQGSMALSNHGEIEVEIVNIGGAGRGQYHVYIGTSILRENYVGTVTQHGVGRYDFTYKTADGSMNPGYLDHDSLASVIQRTVLCHLDSVEYHARLAAQAVVAADPTHVCAFNSCNQCEGCGRRQISKKEQVQTLRLEALPYEADADSSLVRTRGDKCALLCKGKVGFYFPSEVGDTLASLVEVGLDVQVLAPTTVEIN